LIPCWCFIQFFANSIQANDRAFRKSTSYPGILARSRQTGHHCHLTSKVFVRQITWVAVFCSEVLEPAVRGGEFARLVEAIQFAAEFLKKADFVEQFFPISTLPAKNVSPGQESQEVASRCLADEEDLALRVVAINQVERRLVMAHQSADLFSGWKASIHLPKDAACVDGPSNRMASARDATILFARARWLRLVMQNRGGEDHLAISFRERAPDRQRGHRLTDHARMDPDITLRVEDRILRTAAHCSNPLELSIESRPIHAPFGSRRAPSRN
jgi:hypothetical protein